MGRMIDTDAAYAVLTDYYRHSTDTQHAALKEALGRVETVDAVEVVRCKNCKYWRINTDHTCKEHSLVSPMLADGFCSRGKRKDGDHAEGTIQEEQS